MKRFEVARQFDLMADLLEIQDENPFRVRAYRRAAQALSALTEDLEDLVRQGRLEEIPGIGGDLAGKIQEYLATGRIREIEAARRAVPAGVVELMQVPGIGPRTARRLAGGGIRDLGALERAARTGRLRGLPGIQARTEQNILAGIAVARRGQARIPLGRALPLARELAAALERAGGANQIAVAGSVRRMKDTVGDVDILVTSIHPARVMRAFVGLPQVAAVLEQGPTRASVRHQDGIQVDLRVVEPACFGAALAYFTGSKQHNIRIRERAQKRGLKISEYGVFRAATGRRVAGRTEVEVYAAVGLPWIPPELREDAGEVEAAAAGRLPGLVRLQDIRGDLHCHTRASDGQHTVDALAAAAAARGWQYLAITDHSRSARVAGGLTAEEARAHADRVRTAARRHPGLTLLAGTECDILPDGSLDYPDTVLARLDLVVAAVHSHFTQSRAEMTQRICRALAHPRVHLLAHPTGRLLGQREPYEVDLDEVLRVAARHGKAVEVNAQADRLDLDGVHCRRARGLGVLLAVDTDAHVLDHFAWMELGVATARRGWVEASQVVNTWPLPRLLAWTRRPAAGEGEARRVAGRGRRR